METPSTTAPELSARTGRTRPGPNSPAWIAITDFTIDGPITVPPDLAVEDARGIMQRMGVHALLVTPDDAAFPERCVLGLVTAYDLGRTTPVWDRRSGPPVSPAGALRVRDCMTGRDDLPVVHYESLKSLTVRDLHEHFQGTGLTHLLVVELCDDGVVAARGLVSRAAISRVVRADPGVHASWR